MGLGLFRDNSALLNKAADYLIIDKAANASPLSIKLQKE